MSRQRNRLFAPIHRLCPSILLAALLAACGTVTGPGEDPNGNGEDPVPCSEGDRRCLDERTAERCSEAGEWEPVPCATGTQCDGGFCLAVSCDPGERRCKDARNAEECSETGTRWILEPCPEPGACTEEGVCVSYHCWPSETRCASEEIQETCASDGSGWSGAFCIGDDRCLGSSCATPICEPGETRCESDSHIGICRADGSEWDSTACPTPGACRNDDCVTFACEPGTRRCASPTVAEECAVDGSGWISEPCGVDELCAEGSCAVPVCEPRESRCADENTVESCRADGSGWQSTSCGDSASCVYGACVGEVVCSPGSAGCYDEVTVGICSADGTVFEPGASCPVGETCSGGICTSDPCSATTQSHLGCEFWPVVLPNLVADKFKDYAAAVVVNPGDVSVQVRLFQPDESTPHSEVEVQPGSSREIHLPWNGMSPFVNANGNYDAQSRRGSRAYRLTSSRPVAVWLFNPVETELPSGCRQSQDCPTQGEICIVDRGVCDRSDRSNTNDAMLLLPTSALGNRYLVSSLPHFQAEETMSFSGFPLWSTRTDYPSLVAVAAIESGTTSVTVTTKSALAPGDGMPERSAGSSFTLSLAQQELVQLASAAQGSPNEVVEGADDVLQTFLRQFPASDPTGTLITSNKPVAVYVGFNCRNVPFDQRYCDHISEQLLPEASWGHQAVAGRSQSSGIIDYGDVWRVVAANDNTQITFVPAAVHGSATLQAGDHLSLRTTSSFLVQSQGSGHPIHLTQFFSGSAARDATIGDPAQISVPAIKHYRRSHVVYVPASFEGSYATIVRPTGATVTIDGVSPTASWQTIGASAFQVARVELYPGIRRIVGSAPLGVTLYGHHSGSSFGTSGGLSLP